MAEGVRKYRKGVTIVLAEPEAFNDWRSPTAAELNNPLLVYEITCALSEEGTVFTLGDPETDSTLSFCDEAGIETPTTPNPEVVLEIFRNELNDNDEIAPDGVYNLAFNLLKHADVNYFAVLRVGKDSDEPFAIGDRVNLVGINTDLPVDVYGVNEKIRLSNTGLPDGNVNWRWKLVS
jgi:hypothetical protein